MASRLSKSLGKLKENLRFFGFQHGYLHCAQEEFDTQILLIGLDWIGHLRCAVNNRRAPTII